MKRNLGGRLYYNDLLKNTTALLGIRAGRCRAL